MLLTGHRSYPYCRYSGEAATYVLFDKGLPFPGLSPSHWPDHSFPHLVFSFVKVEMALPDVSYVALRYQFDGASYGRGGKNRQVT